MYKDFTEKHPEMKLSYSLYRRVVSDMKISFANLGHEECFNCEEFGFHKNLTKHIQEMLEQDCDICKKYIIHIEMAKSARTEYRKDVEENSSLYRQSSVICSADLQKVVMLPRCEMFKEVIFVPRLIAFNMSFVPVGKQKKSNPIAIIWHEAVSGRMKEDIISAYYAYFLKQRDKEKITLWLDNCSAQNKNWAIFCFFVYIVNCSQVNLNSLTIKYFQSGHTFMSADAFHHQVEHALKRKKKVYDFQDFHTCVQSANSGNVDVINLELQNFYNWIDSTSQYKLGKINPRPYLQNMVQVEFIRGKKSLSYKTQFDGELIELNFLKAACQKRGLKMPTLLKRLEPIIPQNRLEFWKSLPTTEVEADL